MTDRIRLSQAHFRKTSPDEPVIKPIGQWLPANQGFYDGFRGWLRAGGYSPSALMLYSVSARLALGLLDKAYWLIEPEPDLAEVEQYLERCYDNAATKATYRKGLHKLAHYLAVRNRQPMKAKPLNWAYYCAHLPDWLQDDIRAYLKHRARAWLPEQRHRATLDMVSHLTGFLRWTAQQQPLTNLADLTPQRWFDYVDQRLQAGIKPVTLNGELHSLQALLRFVADDGRSICQRTLLVDSLREQKPLPRDVPLPQLQQVYAQIELDIASPRTYTHRLGVLDRVWFLLMLHSGLRTGEVRRLKQADLELTVNRVRLTQAKGLKDRIVYLSPATVAAIEVYLPQRGPASSDHLLLFRHRPLSVTYCLERLKRYSQRCGLYITPHQLRHSCATLLLNAGVPILTVQAILGHKYIDTTLGYARLYDGTVAADYYRAMAVIEPQLLGETEPAPTPPGQMLALLDSLHNSTLNPQQRETVQSLRQAIAALNPEPETLVIETVTKTEGDDA